MNSIMYRGKGCAIRTLFVTAIAVIVVTSISHRVYGHEDLPETIEKISREIKKDPRNADLYLARSYFYVLDGKWEKSLADIDIAERLSKGELDAVSLLRSKAWFVGGELARDEKQKQDRLLKSLSNVDLFIRKHPEHPDAFNIKAETLAGLGRYEEAIPIHRELIGELRQDPGPSYYIKHADWLIADKRPAEALEFLDIGINHLGKVAILQDKAISIELSQQNFQSALERVDTLLSGTRRKYKYLVEKADILVLNGRDKEALNLYNKALEEIAALPSTITGKKHIIGLKEQIKGKKEGIKVIDVKQK